MAGYTKEQYDEAYKFGLERHFGGRPAGQQPVVLHYHKFFMRPRWITRWQNLQAILQVPSTDLVCIVGAGFGWGVEGFIAATGCTTVGIDISDYIDAEKNNTEEAELRAQIAAVGLDPDSGRGAFLLAQVYDGQPRTNVVVLKEDGQTNTSRNAIKSTLGGWPDTVIFEDTLDDSVTDQEIVQANNAANLFAGTQRVIWVMTETANRTAEDVFALTGSEVITKNLAKHLVP